MAFPSGLVSNILQKSSALDETHLEESIQKVGKRCSDLKIEVYELLKQDYEEFLSNTDTTLSLENRVQEVVSEFKRLSVRVDNDLKGRILKSSGKKEEIEQQMKETKEKIRFVEDLVTVYQTLGQAEKEKLAERYLLVARLLKKVTVSLQAIGQSGCKAKVYQVLSSELAFLVSNLKCQLQDKWTEFVYWKPAPPTEELSLEDSLNSQLCILDGSHPQLEQFLNVAEAFKAIGALQEWNERAKRFAVRIYQAFIKPLVLKRNIVLVAVKSKGLVILSLHEETTTDEFTIDHALDEILTLLNMVREMFPVGQQTGWMQQLGESIEPNITPLLKQLLAKGIPKTPTQREKFSHLAEAVARFEKTLKGMQFVSEDYCELSGYTNNVDSHVASQRCQELLARARHLLTQPIHNTTSVGIEDTVELFASLGLGNPMESGVDYLQKKLTETDTSLLSFAFPPCLISSSAKDFTLLVLETLQECASSPSTCVQLYHTVRDMIEVFVAVAHGHHQSVVAAIPRNAVVQHNNFMYLAHQLVAVGHQFQSHIPLGVSLIDYVPRLRRLGEEYFLAEMEKQSSHILEFLKLFKTLEGMSSCEEIHEEVHRAVRQVLLHIYKLGKVYSEVLPANLYQRCLGALLNVLVSELISRTISLEDIAMDDASEIHELLTLELIEKSPVALALSHEEEASISSLCPSWEKMKELAFVLDARQYDIVERWSKGNGPLAKQFSVAEVKQLIRALFKNTELRAETLSKITK